MLAKLTQLPWIWGAPRERGFAASQLSQRTKECTCWAGAGAGQFYPSLEQRTAERPRPGPVQLLQTSALSLPAAAASEGLFKGCRQLVSFSNWAVKAGNKPSLHGQAAGGSLAGLPAGPVVSVAISAAVGWMEVDFSFRERKPLFPSTPKKPRVKSKASP